MKFYIFKAKVICKLIIKQLEQKILTFAGENELSFLVVYMKQNLNSTLDMHCFLCVPVFSLIHSAAF